MSRFKNLDDRRKFIDEVKRNTERWSPSVTSQKIDDPGVVKAIDAINAAKGKLESGELKILATIFEVIMDREGEIVPFLECGDFFGDEESGCIMVVPLDDPNSHSYELGEPCLVFHPLNNAICYSGMYRVGNYLPEGIKFIRPANEDEIDKFFNLDHFSEFRACVLENT
ncbi:hypothetical protein ACFL08_00020 [Patescibacteria group bacterium]